MEKGKIVFERDVELGYAVSQPFCKCGIPQRTAADYLNTLSYVPVLVLCHIFF